ncbi:phosphoribosyltransferase [bacterium]|nr:phosphoribosyltransferase [bacterium]
MAERLTCYQAEKPLVLGLPRGGVSVAYEVARALQAPLDVWVVRKVGVPRFPELGLGAVAEGGIVYLNRDTMRQVGVEEDEVEGIVPLKAAEVAERVQLFRGDRPAPQLTGRTVLMVDDGIATGATVRASLQALQATHPGKVVLAVPVAATQSLVELRSLVDDIVCLMSTPRLHAVGAWYEDFTQVSDHEVLRLLELAAQTGPCQNGNG